MAKFTPLCTDAVSHFVQKKFLNQVAERGALKEKLPQQNGFPRFDGQGAERKWG